MIKRFAPLAALVVLVGATSGCAMGSHSGHHSSGSGTAMDMQAMCEMHKKMMSDPSHQARMQEHMKSMTPEMRQRMMAMHEKCK